MADLKRITDIDISCLGALKDVQYDTDADNHNWISAVSLVFDETTLVVSVNDEDDTIRLSAKRSVHFGQNRTSNNQFDTLIPSLVSLQVQWIWEMTNQQGYRDGLQLEFFDRESSKDHITIQFIAIASGLQVYSLTRLY